jgi:hypothetical protein
MPEMRSVKACERTPDSKLFKAQRGPQVKKGQ